MPKGSAGMFGGGPAAFGGKEFGGGPSPEFQPPSMGGGMAGDVASQGGPANPYATGPSIGDPGWMPPAQQAPPPASQPPSPGAGMVGTASVAPQPSMPAGIQPQPPMMDPKAKTGGAPVNGAPASTGMSSAADAQSKMMARAAGPQKPMRRPAPVASMPPKPNA